MWDGINLIERDGKKDRKRREDGKGSDLGIWIAVVIDQTKWPENEAGTWGSQLVQSGLYDRRTRSRKYVTRHGATGLHDIGAFLDETYSLEAKRRVVAVVGNLEDCDRGAR
jgi:hypothetical protein